MQNNELVTKFELSPISGLSVANARKLLEQEFSGAWLKVKQALGVPL